MAYGRQLRQVAQIHVCSASLAADKALLGKTGLEVPAIGIGAWSWGDKFFWNDGSWDGEKDLADRIGFQNCYCIGGVFTD